MARSTIILASVGLLIAAAGGLMAGLLAAGPLNPPPGAVTSTYKTLTEVEPRIAISALNTPGDADSLFKITQPGSYYLTGNITGAVGKHGIEIVASGVTLDLNGFDLVGVPAMGAFDGVSVTVDSLRSITVTNGTARNWGDGGVDLGFLSRGCRVEGVLASGNAGTGINASISSTVSNCTAAFNAQRGIRASNASTISHCSVESNTGNGIEVNSGCTISNCSAYFNSAVGILAGTGCSVVDCSASTNTSHGLQIGDGGSLARCSALSNTQRGINAGESCTIADCVANFNGSDGIRGSDGSIISGSTAKANAVLGIVGGDASVIRGCFTTSNGRSGIQTNKGAITNCTAGLNTEYGIVLVSGGSVTDCASFENTLSGIFTGGSSTIRNNTCFANGSGAGDGAGIEAFGSDSRIEGNNCSAADRGIHVRLAGNIIIGNTCSGNTTDWLIVANNNIGPILDRRSPASAAINGFSSPTSLNTTDPHANFSY